MEKEENIKVLSPESADDQYVYYIDKSLPLSDQVITKEGDNCLINVRKIYTNNIYFGVSYTTFDPLLGVQHQFRCKDRPLGDLSVVNDKEKFLSLFLFDENRYRQKQAYLRQKEVFFNLPYRVFFCYDENDCYEHTLYLLEDGRILRGLYGAKDKEHLKILLREYSGFATLGPPTKKEVIAYYEDKMTSYANNQISVSTDYSEIIIEHTTQYEQEWSDIKRRKLWLKNHQ